MDIEEVFKKQIGAKFENLLPVEYAFQDINDLPEGFTVPDDRTKPWGTAHAIRAARDKVDTAFAAINADDFYGREAYEQLAKFLTSVDDEASEQKKYAMVGYLIESTLSEHGSVARGICSLTEDGCLANVVERTKLAMGSDGVITDAESGVVVQPHTRVSMNCWGFSLSLFDELEKKFPEFLKQNATNLKAEWYIPFVVDELIQSGKAAVKMLPTNSPWFGVTYREDKEAVSQAIKKLVDAGEYPSNLFA